MAHTGSRGDSDMGVLNAAVPNYDFLNSSAAPHYMSNTFFDNNFSFPEQSYSDFGERESSPNVPNFMLDKSTNIDVKAAKVDKLDKVKPRNTSPFTIEALSPSETPDSHSPKTPRPSTRSRTRRGKRIDKSTAGKSQTGHPNTVAKFEDADSPFDKDLYDVIDSDDEEDEAPPIKKKRGTTRPKGARTQRKKSLERNRVAASKCRQKKKEWMQNLEDHRGDLEKKHHTLASEFNSLVEEITQLKNTLMGHAACNDENIDTWIKSEAVRFVKRVCQEKNSTVPAGTNKLAKQHSTSNAESLSDDPDDSISLPTPSDVDMHRMTISPKQRKPAEFNFEYMPDSLFGDDMFMAHPQECI